MFPPTSGHRKERVDGGIDLGLGLCRQGPWKADGVGEREAGRLEGESTSSGQPVVPCGVGRKEGKPRKGNMVSWP